MEVTEMRSELNNHAGSPRSAVVGEDDVILEDGDALTTMSTRASKRAPESGARLHLIPVTAAKVPHARRLHSDLARAPLTDFGNLQRFVARQGEDVRYVAAWKAWLVWDGRRWTRDVGGEVQRRARI